MPDCGVHYLWFAFVCFFIRSHTPWGGFGTRHRGGGGCKPGCSLQQTCNVPKSCQNGSWLANQPDLTSNARSWRGAHKCFCFCRERIWVDLVCVQMGGVGVSLKSWVKRGCNGEGVSAQGLRGRPPPLPLSLAFTALPTRPMVQWSQSAPPPHCPGVGLCGCVCGGGVAVRVVVRGRVGCSAVPVPFRARVRLLHHRGAQVGGRGGRASDPPLCGPPALGPLRGPHAGHPGGLPAIPQQLEEGAGAAASGAGGAARSEADAQQECGPHRVCALPGP